MERIETYPEIIDCLGIGLGPSNLSLAALAAKHPGLGLAFLEKKKRFDWHEGILFPDSTMQSSFLRDLVTPVDPANPLSFVAFLQGKKRLYQYLASNFHYAPRFEFNAYFRWASEQLLNIRFDHHVNEIRLDSAGFKVHTSKGILRSKNLVLGVGNLPFYPNHAFAHIGEQVFHGSAYSRQDRSRFAGKRVAIVGGGQTGAEIFKDLLTGANHRPSELAWISSRSSFNPMEESPFLTEVFTPAYSRFYHGLPREAKLHLLKEQKLASDGVSQATLEAIYQALYTQRYHTADPVRTILMVESTAMDLRKAARGFDLEVKSKLDGSSAPIGADIVIYCTGYEFRLPTFFSPIADRIVMDGNDLRVDGDFALRFKEESPYKIYVQNAATLDWGVADRNLVLGAWRSASILNGLLGRPAYDLSCDETFIDWARRK